MVSEKEVQKGCQRILQLAAACWENPCGVRFEVRFDTDMLLYKFKAGRLVDDRVWEQVVAFTREQVLDPMTQHAMELKLDRAQDEFERKAV